MHKNILELWNRNGSLFLTQYLSECVRAVICWAGSESFVSNKVRVKLSSAGLPVIIPASLRVRMYQMKRSSTEGWLITKVVLTVLSVYRVIGCPPNLKLGTITDPFTGVTRSLPLAELRRAMTSLKLRKLKSPNLMNISESSGPNHPRATWSCAADALALMRYPRNWMSIMRWCHKYNGPLVIAWLLWINLFSLLLVPFLVYYGVFPKYIGRLAKLNEARGKVRVIAITDYWTQLILKPLHDSIYKLLTRIEEDGTFNQVRPFHALMKKASLTGAKVNSFDLSSATDRLPIDIQVDILSILGIDGELWKAILSRPWYLVSREDGIIVKEDPIWYSVGQPMGAYSSFGMLALTHHILVQVAARRVGYTDWFRDYALLGDDIVILGDAVSNAYLSIMRDLGVEINLLKSHQGYVGEFAKHWIHPHYGDLSPVGAGSILVAVRNYKLIPAVVLDAVQKGFPYALAIINNLVVDTSRVVRKTHKKTITAMLLLMLGPTGALGATNQLSVETLEAWLSVATSGVKRGFILQAIQNALMQIKLKEDDDLVTQYSREQETFKRLWYRYPLSSWGLTFDWFIAFRGFNRTEGKMHPWIGYLPGPALWRKRLNWTFGFNFLDSIFPTSLELWIPEIVFNKDMLWAPLVRISPAYVAYRDKEEPDEAMWYNEDFLYLEPDDPDRLIKAGRIIRSMLGFESDATPSIDWSKEKSIRTYLDSQLLLLRIVGRRLQALSKPKGPVKTALMVI
jgi:hypothetical protein